jgi:hypothetical protein
MKYSDILKMYPINNTKIIKKMIIKVNKNQQQIEFRKHIWTIIEIAKQKADNGINQFYYSCPKGYGFDTWKVIEEVEKLTEESVYGGYKCVKGDGLVRFSIRT